MKFFQALLVLLAFLGLAAQVRKLPAHTSRGLGERPTSPPSVCGD